VFLNPESGDLNESTEGLAESASTGDMQVSVMPSDNNNFAVSHGIYTFDIVWSWAQAESFYQNCSLFLPY